MISQGRRKFKLTRKNCNWIIPMYNTLAYQDIYNFRSIYFSWRRGQGCVVIWDRLEALPKPYKRCKKYLTWLNSCCRETSRLKSHFACSAKSYIFLLTNSRKFLIFNRSYYQKQYVLGNVTHKDLFSAIIHLTSHQQFSFR